MHYYKTEKEVFKGKSQGFINLKKVTGVEKSTETPQKKVTKGTEGPFFFDIITDDRIYHLSASTENEQLRWIDGVKNAVRQINPDFQKPALVDSVPPIASDSTKDEDNSTEDSAEEIHLETSSVSSLKVNERERPESIDCNLEDCTQLLSAIKATYVGLIFYCIIVL